MTCDAGEPAGILPARGRRHEGEEAMKTLFRRRQLVAMAAAVLATTGLTRIETARAHTGGTPAAAAAGGQSLREGMRKLWSEHVFWTREYVVAAIDGPPAAAEAAAARLMRNQEDIGGAIATYYGAPAGDKLTSLLKEHILIAVDLVAAAKASQPAKIQAADARWHLNADEIAAFLSQANPHWPRQPLADAMRMHLETTTAQVLARLHHEYPKDVAAFDAVYEHILHMSDVLADGILEQFPARAGS
jgi:hypothetical protein